MWFPNKNKQGKLEKTMRDLVQYLTFYHYMPIGERTIENYFDREDAIEKFKRIYGKHYEANKELIEILLNQFTDSPKTETKVPQKEYLFTEEKIKQMRDTQLLDELSPGELQTIIEDISNRARRNNGEQLFLYLWVAKFFRPSLIELLQDYSIPFDTFRAPFINKLFSIKEKDYDLVSRSTFIQAIQPYVSEEILQYYKGKQEGQSESAHMLALIQTVEECAEEGSIPKELAWAFIGDAVKEYEAGAIEMEKSNNAILYTELKNLGKRTRWLSVGVIFIFAALLGYIYFI